MHSVLQVKDLSVRVPAENGMLTLIENVEFDLKSGQVLGLVGESGSGKTVACSSLLRLLDDSAVVTGSIQVKGRELTGLNEKALQRIRGREIGMIMQNPMNALTPVHTIGSQFVETIRSHLMLTRRQAFELAVESLSSVNFTDPRGLMKRYPFHLSGGMLQRVMIAMTMCLKPAVVIADEPTTALDTVNQLQVLKQLEYLRTEGTAIILITHDLSVIAEMADEVMVICKGKIIEKSDVYQLFDHPQHEYTRKLLDMRFEGTRSQEKSSTVSVNNEWGRSG